MSVSNSQWDFETVYVDGGGAIASDLSMCDGGGNDGIE